MTSQTPHAGPASGGAPFFRELEIEFLIHELKDPVAIIETGMRTLLERQDKYGQLTARQENTLKRSLRNTKKVRDMLNGLLEIGRSEAGRFLCCEFAPLPVMYVVLLETLEITGGHASEQPEGHHFSLSGGLLAPAEEVRLREFLAEQQIFIEAAAPLAELLVWQDQIKFRQIFGNLLKNALHHRRQRIDIVVRHADDKLWIEVTDDGPGLDPEHHEFIFQRYTQVSANPTLPRKGHGLGLAGALILAKSLGGTLEVRSMKGQGATFCFMLPIMLQYEPPKRSQEALE